MPSSDEAPPTDATCPPPAAGGAAAVEVESSPQDDRTYLSHTLPNNLRCLLISDPTTDKAAAAIDVRVGHLSDPDDVPGLAHFCEHMLFLGTEKYPDENEYNQYLQQHGGHSNAFTDMESTNYYFDVSAEHLDGALDRFAQFFISPRFTPEATDREMNAVDSEHSKNLQNDHWRMFQLYKSLARPDHPFHKFGSGNLKTLKEDPTEKGLDLRTVLLDFHGKYYSSNVMRLVVLGKESVEELRELVDKLFSDVTDKNVTVPEFPGTPYPPSALGRRMEIVPVQQKRELDITFPLRESNTLYRKKPLKYISHLIGHEGKGSVLALLRERGWANELSAGESRQCSDWSAFSVTIDLTDEGLEQVENVTAVIFAYLNMLRKSGPQRWVHDETATVSDTHFRFLSKREPMDYVCSVAGAMQLYPENHTLCGPYKVWEYDEQLITECMKYLVPKNAVVAVSAKAFEGKTSQKEEWYSVEYNIADVDPTLLKRWEEASVDDADLVVDGLHLALPERNDMIATDFELRKIEDFPLDEPRLARDTPTCRLWYKPDNVFDMPKINVMATLRTAVAYDSPEAAVLSLLYVEILREHTTEFTYLATMAGLHCSFVNARQGLELHVSGYNHKADVLVKRIVDSILALPDKLTNAEGSDELFERIKDKVSKQYRNFMVGAQPYQHAFYGADLVLEENKWSVPDKMAALETVKVGDVIAFAGRVLGRFHLEMLVHGNATPDEASAVADAVLDGLKPGVPFKANLPQLRVVELDRDPTKEYVHRFVEYNPEDPNSALENVYQIGRVDLRTNAILSFLVHLIQEPAFNELRTQEQLGYIIHTSVKTTGDDVKGLLILIMSDSYDPLHLDDRVEAFLDRFRSKVVHMPQEEFDSHIQAVVTNFFEKNKNLGEESTKYWAAVNDQKYIFRKFRLIGEHVKTLSRVDVLRFFDKYVARGGSCRSKLSVQVFAEGRKEGMTTASGAASASEGEEGDAAASSASAGEEEGDAAVKSDDDDDAKQAVSAQPVKVKQVIITEEDIVDFKRSMPLYPLPGKVDVEGMKMSSSASETSAASTTSS